MELFSKASATTFSLKATLYKERQAFGMIAYDNFEREGLFETGLQTLDSTGECFVMLRVVLFIYFKHVSRDHIKFDLPVSVICRCFQLNNQKQESKWDLL